MKEKWIGFIKEQLPVTITVFLSDGFLILFYTLSTDTRIEIVYPMALSAVCYSIYMVWSYFRFTHYQRALLQMKECQDSRVHLQGYTEITTLHTFQEVHKRYTEEIFKKEENQMRQHRFLSACVHAMKTPITVSQLLIERLEQRTLSKEEFVPQFKEEQEKLLCQLESVLNMLRLKEFEKDYSPQAISLEEEVRRIINNNKKLFIGRHVFPKLVVEKNIPSVYTDRKWNEAILTQVLSNAIKYTEKENSYIKFTIYHEGKSIALKIEDEGIGIPSYDLGRIFEPFFTGENGRREKQSSGIGLYFCKEVCTMLHHDIEVQSVVGEGTTVWLRYLAKL